jgi:hypothetical protein
MYSNSKSCVSNFFTTWNRKGTPWDSHRGKGHHLRQRPHCIPTLQWIDHWVRLILLPKNQIIILERLLGITFSFANNLVVFFQVSFCRETNPFKGRLYNLYHWLYTVYFHVHVFLPYLWYPSRDFQRNSSRFVPSLNRLKRRWWDCWAATTAVGSSFISIQIGVSMG